MCSGGSVYKGERRKYWYLVCNNLANRTINRCQHGARIKYEDLLEIVRCDLNALLSFDEAEIEQITQEAIRQANASLGVENKEQTLADIETKSKRIIKMIERAYRDNAAGNLSDELLDEMMERFGKERQALEEQRQKLLTDTSEDQSIRNAYTLFFDIEMCIRDRLYVAGG